MEGLFFIVTDANSKESAKTTALPSAQDELYSPDSVWFLNNVSYIFQDDEDVDTKEHLDYENVVVVDGDINGNISKVELISENWQLLSFEQNENENWVSLNVMSELKENANTRNLQKLAQLYHERNSQLRKLIDSINLSELRHEEGK